MDKEKELQFVKYNRFSNEHMYLGERSGVPRIAKLKYIAEPILDPDTLIINDSIMENSRYKKSLVSVSGKFELTTIYPALQEDLDKLGSDGSTRVIETYDQYMESVYPRIKDITVDWINEIMTGKSEQEDILYQDSHFIFIPDLKWTRQDMKEAYCLAIVKDYRLKSIRDLTGIHISLLQHIYDTGLSIMCEKFGCDESKLRVYIHYHPTYWHLHIHFNIIETNHRGVSVDYCHTMLTVINNLKMMSNYYQVVALEYLMH